MTTVLASTLVFLLTAAALAWAGLAPRARERGCGGCPARDRERCAAPRPEPDRAPGGVR